MTKQWIIPVFAAFFALSILASCGGNSENNAKLQEPTAQQGAATDNQAMPADQAAKAEEKGEQEENEAAIPTMLRRPNAAAFR